MPVLEPGEYSSVTLDKLVVTEEGDMVLHIRVRSSGGYSVIHHHMGKIPPTTEEGYASLCIWYLRLKFPSDLVDTFLQEMGSKMEWEQYVDKDRLQFFSSRGHVRDHVYDILHTTELVLHFTGWYQIRDGFHP